MCINQMHRNIMRTNVTIGGQECITGSIVSTEVLLVEVSTDAIVASFLKTMCEVECSIVQLITTFTAFLGSKT